MQGVTYATPCRCLWKGKWGGLEGSSHRLHMACRGAQASGTKGPEIPRPVLVLATSNAQLQPIRSSGPADEALSLCTGEQGAEPSVSLYRCLLKTCSRRKDLAQARGVYSRLTQQGSEWSTVLGEDMVITFVKCGALDDALQVFQRLPNPTVVAWTAVISGYSMAGRWHEALGMYQRMQDEGVEPDAHTFVTLLTGCGIFGDLEVGKRLHHEALKYKGGADAMVCSSLIYMYAKCGSVTDARHVFDGIAHKNAVTWNAMLVVYSQKGEAERVLQLYQDMQDEGVTPNSRTFVSALQACGILAGKEQGIAGDGRGRSAQAKSLEKGRIIHAHAQSKGCVSDVFVGNTLISMYGKCGSVADAEKVFELLAHRNVVSWNAMVGVYVELGQAENALLLYSQMNNEGVIAKPRTFVRVLQACSMLAEKQGDASLDGQLTKVKFLEQGKAVHSDARMLGSDLDVFVGNALVSMYGKCGSISDAQNVFNGLTQHDIVSWNTLVSAYTHQGHAEKALQLYEDMQREGVSPDAWTYATVLQACATLAENEEAATVDGQSMKVKALGMARAIHSGTMKNRCKSDVFVGNILVTVYGKCGSVVDAQTIFDTLHQRDVVTWNALLKVYAQEGQAEKVLQLYEDMCELAIGSEARTFVTVLQACGMLAEKGKDFMLDGRLTEVNALGILKAIHAHARVKSCDQDVFVGIALIRMYGKLGSSVDARIVFDGLAHRDVVTWNTLLVAYAQQGDADSILQLYAQMQKDGTSPNNRTFVITLQACGMLAEREEEFVVQGPCSKLKSLEYGKSIHADAQKRGLDSDIFVGNTLVSLYGKCGSIVAAKNVFDGMPHRTVVTWNAMLAAYVGQGQAEKALLLYEQMRKEEMSADDRTFVSAVQACRLLAEVAEDVNARSSSLKPLERGRAIHEEAQKKGYDKDSFVGNTLVIMYGKCESLVDAQNVFDQLSERDVVSWNALLAAYVGQGYAEKSLQLYARMQEEGVDPDNRTFVNVLLACGKLAENEEAGFDGRSTKVKAWEKGMAVHADAHSKGYDSDVFVSSALVTMYGKCGSIEDARTVFDGISQREVVTWTAMMGAYVDQGQPAMALQLFRQMQEEGPNPNEITIVYTMQACSDIGSLTFLREIHHHVSRERKLTLLLANTLISAYGRCASMVDAQSVFDTIPEPNLVSWSALIAGYAREGNWASSLQCYEDMQLARVNPDPVTFVALLSACVHAGLVDKGVEYFEAMSRDYGITPRIEHYVSMVDLLARAGCFRRIEELLSTMPMQPNLDIWLSLLAACRNHGKVVLGKQAFDSAVRLKPKHAAAFVLMSNLYDDAGLDRCAKEIRECGRMAGAWKKPPGQSWVEHKQGVHTFVVGDSNYLANKQLQDLLGTLSKI